MYQSFCSILQAGDVYSSFCETLSVSARVIFSFVFRIAVTVPIPAALHSPLSTLYGSPCSPHQFGISVTPTPPGLRPPPPPPRGRGQSWRYPGESCAWLFSCVSPYDRPWWISPLGVGLTGRGASLPSPVSILYDFSSSLTPPALGGVAIAMPGDQPRAVLHQGLRCSWHEGATNADDMFL